MSLRSLLLAALLLAALASAQDVFMSYWFNMTPTMLCAADAPSRCYYIPRVDPNIDPSKTLVIVTYKCATLTGVCNVLNLVGDYSLLRYVFTSSPTWYIVNITRPGLLYAQASFRIGPPGSGDRDKVSAAQYTACGKTYQYAYYVTGGSYNITPLPLPLYLVDLERCVEYRIAAHVGAVVNITAGWFSLYLAEMMPPASRIYTSSYSIVLNGTQHAYFTQFHHRAAPAGAGFYITGSAVPTLVIDYSVPSVWYGPRHYSAWRNNTLLSSFSPMYGLYVMGEAPSDGVFAVYPLSGMTSGPFTVAYIANNTAGYFLLYPRTLTGGVVVYAKRFDIVELTLSDAIGYLYNTRGVACPAYSSIASTITAWTLSRLDRLGEIEICNNRTSAVYVALYHTATTAAVSFFYADKIEPGRCARLRWDTALSTKPTLFVYATARDVCSRRQIFSTTNYNPGWRHHLFQNNTLRPAAPIAPDYDYASLWQQLLNLLSQQYTNLLNNFTRWYASQANATSLNLTDFFKSQPRFIGTIKMDAATSTWLKTTLNELQRWQTPGVAPSFGAVALPQIPIAVAPAAAAAVAVAWAASRRDDDVATTAAVAGIALALFGILMTLVYGTSSLTLVALGVIVAAAAAAWRRI